MPCLVQAAIEEHRAACLAADILLRPTLFACEKREEPEAEASEAHAASPSTEGSPSKNLSPTQTLYLQSRGSFQGVLQVHKARFTIRMRRVTFWPVPTVSHSAGAGVECRRLCVPLAHRRDVARHASAASVSQLVQQDASWHSLFWATSQL